MDSEAQTFQSAHPVLNLSLFKKEPKSDGLLLTPKPWGEIFGSAIELNVDTVVVRMSPDADAAPSEERSLRLIQKSVALIKQQPETAPTQIVVDLRGNETLYCSRSAWNRFRATVSTNFRPSGIMELYELMNDRHPSTAIILR